MKRTRIEKWPRINRVARTALFAALSVVMLSLVSPPALAGAAEPLSSQKILDHVDDLFRGESSHGIFAMTVVTANYSRELTMEGWSRGKDLSLIRILAPRKEQGVATLKDGTNVWNYLPQVRRVIKVPSSMMGGSWMGSHFTNDDLVKESRMAEDYAHSIGFQGERDGRAIIEITLEPKPEAPVVWGKVEVAVQAADWMPLQVTYYDEDLRLARTLSYTEVRTFGGRAIPSRMRMVPSDKPQEHTEIVYRELRYDVPLSDEIFSLRNLQR